MKNKFIKILSYAILVVLFGTANFAYALPSLSAEVKTIAVKFSLAMLGVVLFSIVISVGLSLYNKFFVPDVVKDYRLNRDSLRTPKDKDEAIMTFITKNRLK